MGSLHGWAAGLALVFVGCSSGNGGTSMHGDVDALDVHVQEIRAETQAHGAAVAAAPDLNSAMAEEVRHRGEIDGHEVDMDEVMDHMGACHDAMGNPPDVTSMERALEDMLSECTAHMGVVDSAGNMTDVASEEQRHQDAMEAMLTEMDSMMDSMTEHADDYECPTGMM